MWECICDCGKTIVVRSSSLVSGATRSCGCIRMKDFTGQRFGNLTALRATGEVKNTFFVWECICDCGNTVFVQSGSLQSGNTQSCGCLRKAPRPESWSDLREKRFGNLVALQPTNQRQNGYVVWECRCDCGNSAYVSGQLLTEGKTKSCGCIRRQSIKKLQSDLTNVRFGKLKAIRPTDERKRGYVVWECLCDCGSIAYVASDKLKSGRTKSCGCGKRKIQKLDRTETESAAT